MRGKSIRANLTTGQGNNEQEVNPMDKQEIKAKVAELISGGLTKADVFATLTDKGVKDRVAAYSIASYADPQRCRANRGHIRAVVINAWLQVILGVVFGLALGVEIQPLAGLIVGGLVGGIGLLFVFGFSRNKAGAYNAWLLLAMIEIPREALAISKDPIPAIISIAILLALLGYISYVRSRLFPDFLMLRPRKIRGKYVFSDSAPGEK